MIPSSNPQTNQLGQVMWATSVKTEHPTGKQAHKIIILLAASVALMMTGFGIIMPVFARRFGELGGGVEALGLMTMSFALAQLIAAPILGSMADQRGRRPFVLMGLMAFALSNIGYLVADSVALIILVRTLGAAFSAGLFPAAMGVVSDIIPENQRARWIGIIMGGYGAGFVFGPVLGGFLYDGWGYAAPFLVSAMMGGLAFVAAYFRVPETRTAVVRWREELRKRRGGETAVIPQKESLWQTLPRPLPIFATLLFIDFIGAFAFAFVEPQMVFYVYDELGWSTVRFGLVVGSYGLAMVFGQIILGQSSDRFGRKPVIVAGILLSSLLYVSLAFFRSFPLILFATMIAGLGAALIAPAASASYLDMTQEQHRSRIVGVKESVLALGGVLGPLLVVVANRSMDAVGIFVAAGVLVLSGAMMALLFLHAPKQPVPGEASATELTHRRQGSMAKDTLAWLVTLAASSRTQHSILLTHQSAAD